MKTNENWSKAVILRGWQALRQPLVATIFGLLVGAVVILACGHNPMVVYAEMFQKSFFKFKHSLYRNIQKIFSGHRIDGDNLLFYRKRAILRLF